MKVLFLDIDGVLNTFQIYKQPPSHIPKEQLKELDGYYIDICNTSDLRVSNLQAVVWLEKICKELNLSIVISSTWRLQYDKCVQSLRNSGLDNSIPIIGKTPTVGGYRGHEIEAWLKKHPEVTDFVIVDDDHDMEPYMDHLIDTDNEVGFNIRTYNRINNYFRGK